MKEEVAAAARWWADTLRNRAPHYAGRGAEEISFFTELARDHMDPISPLEIDRFEEELAVRLPAFLTAGHWQEALERENWLWALSHRTIATDYQPDPILQEACEAAGFDGSGRLPIKTVMWVNPGSVTVARGYGAWPVYVYPEERAGQEVERE